MKAIITFVLLFILSYSILIYVFETTAVKSVINNLFRQSVEAITKLSLDKAHIETQDYFDENKKKDPNIFYLVYANPAVIAAEHEFASRQGLKEYAISTYSFQFYIFQIFTVPFVFLLSLFIATPMPWKSKIKSLLIALLILFGLIFSKCVLLSLFNISNAGIGIYSMSATSIQLIARIVMMLSLGFSVIFVFCLWLIFGFRKSPFAEPVSNFFKSFQK